MPTLLRAKLLQEGETAEAVPFDDLDIGFGQGIRLGRGQGDAQVVGFIAHGAALAAIAGRVRRRQRTVGCGQHGQIGAAIRQIGNRQQCFRSGAGGASGKDDQRRQCRCQPCPGSPQKR